MAEFTPLYGDSYYSYDIDLDGETYTLTFRWNPRALQFVMEIQDAEENYLVRSIAIVPAFPLIEQYSLEDLAGDFYVVSYEDASLLSEIPIPREIYDSHYMIYDTL